MVVVGDRVLFKSIPGTLRFYGITQFSGGIWCGVELDEPQGKNDGSVNGVKYFECAEAHGIFVREAMLEIPSPESLKKRRQTSTGISRAASRAASRTGSRNVSSASRSSMIEGDETARLRGIVGKLQDKLQAMHSEIEGLKDAVGALDSEKTEIFLKNAKLNEDLEVAAIDKETLEEQNEILKQEIESLKRKNEELQYELDTLKEEMALNGEVDSGDLVKRNEMLELALIKLKEHTEDLERQLERAVVDMEKSEIPKEVLEQHIATQKKLEAAEKKVKELEDMRKDEADLEKLHQETEAELQDQLQSLEEMLDEKNQLIDDLEAKNQELNSVLSDLERQVNRESNFDVKKFEEYKITVVNLQRQKQNIELDLKLLNLEIKQRDSILSTVNSGDLQRSKATHDLRKFAQVYKTLADTININTTDDIYLKALGTSSRFKMLHFSVTLDHAADVAAELSLSYETQDLDVITEEFIHHIKEEEYRSIPDLSVIQQELLERFDVSKTDFPVRHHVKYDTKLQALCLKMIQEVLSIMKSNSPQVTKLYQVSLKRMELVSEIVTRLEKEEEQSNEISQCMLPSLIDQTTHLMDELLTNTTSLDSEFQEPNFSPLIQTLESLPETLTWDTTHIDTSSKKKHLSQDAEALTLEIIQLQRTLSEKSATLEESTSKIQVLEARVAHLRDMEQLVKKYRAEIETLTTTNTGLDERVSVLFTENERLNKELHRAKNNTLLHNSQFESLMEQKKYTERASLVSEIQVLQRAVRMHALREKKERAWLKELPVYKQYRRPKSEVDELREIGRSLQRAVERSRFVAI